MASNRKLMNTKFLPLIKTYISSSGHIFIWKSLDHSILKFERIHSEMLIFRTMDGLKWKTHEYQYCSTHQDLHFIYRPFLHLTKCWQSVVQNLFEVLRWVTWPSLTKLKNTNSSKSTSRCYNYITPNVTIILHKISSTNYYHYQASTVVNFFLT